MDYQKMFESKLEELEKRVAGIEAFYARRSEIPDVSPYLESAKAEETYTDKESFEQITKGLRKLILNTKTRVSSQRDELDKKIQGIKEKLDEKYGSDEVVTTIMYILKLYDKGELPEFG